jgi:hypothetical protein
MATLTVATASRSSTSIAGRALTQVTVLVIELMSFPSSLTVNILSTSCFEYPVRVCVELFCSCLALNIPLTMLDAVLTDLPPSRLL